jgi:tight adherence protein B
MRFAAALGMAAAVWIASGRRRPVTIKIPGPRMLRSSLLAFGGGWVVAAGVGLPASPSLASGAIASTAPGALRRHRTERAQRRTALRWPDFLAAVRSRLSTGAPIPAACAAAGGHIGGRFADFDPPAGLTFEENMERIRAGWADPLADRITVTMEMAARIGGAHVGLVLGALAQSVADDLRLRRAHEAALTEQRLTAGVALLAPWVILALSIITNPTAAESFATRTGNVIVAGGLAATVIGYVMARHTARLSRARRVFA